MARLLNCQAGRDMARRFRHLVSSSLRPACASREQVQAIRGASAGWASFSNAATGTA